MSPPVFAWATPSGLARQPKRRSNLVALRVADGTYQGQLGKRLLLDQDWSLKPFHPILLGSAIGGATPLGQLGQGGLLDQNRCDGPFHWSSSGWILNC